MKKYIQLFAIVAIIAGVFGTVSLTQQQHEARSRASSVDNPIFIDTPAETVTPIANHSNPIQIQHVQIHNNDNNTLITWITSEPTITTFEYGYVQDLAIHQSIHDTQYKGSHTVYMPIADSYFHYFRIQATDNSGKAVISNVYNFKH